MKKSGTKKKSGKDCVLLYKQEVLLPWFVSRGKSTRQW